MKNEKYITAGEFAKLAGTTKRTILWYDTKNILNPKKITEQGYRLYSTDQILEYQKILLLSSIGIPLGEINIYKSLDKLFKKHKEKIKKEIDLKIFRLEKLEEYEENLRERGTLVKPVIRRIKALQIYYIEKESSYADISKHCKELRRMFAKPSRNFDTISIFYENTYKPQKSRIRIGVIKRKGMTLKSEYQGTVKQMMFRPGKVISHVHNGEGETLSLFWKELEKYCRLRGIKVKKNVPDFEIYWKVSDDIRKQFFEIFLPIL